MHTIEDRQLASFRREYLEREKEIQRYIGVYLSGVVIVFSWLIGPQSRPLNEMVLGNDGYNIYAFLIISIVNALFITFLIYKSLDVHDTTQFIAAYASCNSIYTFWERWRRSTYSVTKPARTAYFVALTLLPTLMAATLLTFTASKIFSSDGSLISQLTQIETQEMMRGKSAVAPTPTPSPVSTQSAPDVTRRFSQTRGVFRLARLFFLFVVGLHALPIWFFYQNVYPTKKKWEAIAELKEAQELTALPESQPALNLKRFLDHELPVDASEASAEIVESNDER